MRALIFSFLLLAAPAAAQPDTLKFADTWHGTGLQVDPGGVQSTWTIELTINKDSSGKISYPSLGCESVLHWVASGGNAIIFLEEITEGDCIDGGRIEVKVQNGRLFWFWTKPGVEADASAVLYRGGPIA